jgi:Zn-dependent protease with chaperone function
MGPRDVTSRRIADLESSVEIGNDAVERIRFYRFSSLSMMITILAPLAFGVVLSLTMLFVSIGQGRCWLFESVSDHSHLAAILGMAGVLALCFAIPVVLVVRRVRANLKDFYRETKYDAAEYESFKSALDGVSIGLGISAPQLAVLGTPTVNTLAFREKGKPGVGVTAEALRAGLSRSDKEALMAHEVAHIALGDYFLASSSAGFEYAGYGLAVLLLLLAVLVTVAINVYALIFLAPLFVPMVVSLVDRRMKKKTRMVYRHNDLLADTIAAKLTNDPEALRKTVEKLWALSEQTNARIPGRAHFQGYMFISRPLESGPIKIVTYDGAGATGNKGDSTKIYWVPGKTKTDSRTWFAYESVNQRVENLKAIELGRWSELERPIQRERARDIAALSGVALLMLVIVLALVVPWAGKTGWDFATTNVVWKMIKV